MAKNVADVAATASASTRKPPGGKGLHFDRYFTPPCPHVAPGAHATERFLEQAARLIRFSDIANAAAFLGVPEKTLERWYYDYVERQRQAPAAALQPITQLGIDELALKKSPSVRSGDHRSHEQPRAGSPRKPRKTGSAGL